MPPLEGRTIKDRGPVLHVLLSFLFYEKKNLKQAIKVLNLIKLGLKTSSEKKTLTVFFNHDGGCIFLPCFVSKKIAMSYRSDVKLVEVFHEDLLSYLWIRDYNAGVKTLEKSEKIRCII